MTQITERCGRKLKYPTYNKAEQGVKSLVRRKGESHLHVYKCPECQKFHVGHKPERLRNYKDFRSKRRREHV